MELDYTSKAKDELLRVNALVPDRSDLSPLDSHYIQAITNTVTRNLPATIESYEKVLELTSNTERSQVYVDLGRAHEKNDNVEKAIASYLEATRLDPQYAAAFLRLGVLHGRKQDFAKADSAFSDAERLYNALGNIEGVTEVYYQRGFLLNLIDKSAEARTALQKALEMTRVTSNIPQQIKTLLQLNSVSSTEGNREQAKQYATEAINLAQSNGIETLAANGLIDLGNTFFLGGVADEARKYFEQALDLARRYKGQRTEARALLSLGSLSMQRGETRRRDRVYPASARLL